MARKTKTWAEKLEDARKNKDLPKVEFCKETGKMFAMPCMADVETEMRTVPAGKVRTIRQMTEKFAAKYEADEACPLLTGIFVWIVAHANEEMGQAGIPWWRTVKSDGKLNPKLPEGPDKQRMRLEAEGVEVEDGRGKQPPRVKSLERYLVGV